LKLRNAGMENILDDLKREIRREDLYLKKKEERESKSKKQLAMKEIASI